MFESTKPRGLIVFAGDALALMLGLVLSYAVSPYLLGEEPPEFSFGFVFYCYMGFCLVALFLFYNNGHYTSRMPWWGQVLNILTTLAKVMVLHGFACFLAKSDAPPLWQAIFWGYGVVFILLFRQVAQWICRALKLWGIPTIIIGNGNNMIETAYALHSDNYPGYNLAGIINYDGGYELNPAQLPLQYKKIQVITGAAACYAYIKRNRRKFYILAPEAFRQIDGEALAQYIEQICGKRNYALVPPVQGFSLYGITPQYFFGHDIMFFRPLQKLDSPIRRSIKRLMDITISFSLLVALAPLFLCIMLLIKREKGDIFFGHERVGYNGKNFKCWKFRTMRPDAQKLLAEVLKKNPKLRAEWNADFKLRRDPRVTRLGAFLRKSSLDELPQLWNILKGDMSIVGPRPVTEKETAKYGDKLSVYLSVKPGVTGLWQVSGRNDVSYKYRVYLDTWYVEHWSLWAEVVILFKTVKVVFRKVGAY